MNYQGLRATVMGLGRFGGGATAARWLAERGAIVTVSDQADAASLADALPALSGAPIAAIHLGGHREEDFADRDLIVVNPAVRPDSLWLQIARQSGATLRTELELFLENCSANVIGVTGSNGKSTTAAMIASILKADGRRTFLGGNIGGSLLDQLPSIDGEAWVVLEISSFQLWHFSPSVRMPHIAIVTSCSPNHLDWHSDFSDYAMAKQRLFLGQRSGDFAVLNSFDTGTATWSRFVQGTIVALPSLSDLPLLPVPGQHNQVNAACAAAAATAAGCNASAIRQGLEFFESLPQRLEWFATIEGRRFYNDSTATTPESTMVALRSLDMPIWLISGGKSKGFDFEPLAATIVERACGAAMFGLARDELLLRTTTKRADFLCVAVETMSEALQWCWGQSKPGDAIVLSPACASTDQFRNFQERGQRFVELVRSLDKKTSVML